jgi:hypothetical protein
MRRTSISFFIPPPKMRGGEDAGASAHGRGLRFAVTAGLVSFIKWLDATELKR